MGVNIREEQFEYVELFGKPALFTNARIDRGTVPEGWYAYDLRGSNHDPGEPVTVEPKVGVNHAGTILIHEPVTIPKAGYRSLKGRLDFLGEQYSLKEFCDVRGLNYPTDNRIFALRPASPDEAGLFYSSEQNDTELCTVGHLRMDFGHKGGEFWHTWWEHNGNVLNTSDFKSELDAFMEEMRKSGPLQSLQEMQSYCYTHGGSIAEESHHHGYVAESEHYRFCLRCTPVQGDYNAYLYIYDKRQQELLMAAPKEERGMTMTMA